MILKRVMRMKSSLDCEGSMTVLFICIANGVLEAT